MRPVRSRGVKGKWKGRSIASNASKGRCMAEPTLTFCGCAFFMWPSMTRMSWISLTSSLIVLCPKQATGFTKSGGEPILPDGIRSFSFFLHLWYNAAEKRDGEDARHVLSLLFVEKRRHWLKAL